MSRAAVVIVAWNSAGHLPAAVASVPRGVRVLVVDNASDDGSAEAAAAAGAELVRLPANIGFGPACNLGVSRCPEAEAVLFLNPDAALVDGAGSLQALLAELEADPSVAAAAPALEGRGQELFQLRRLPTLGSLAREAFLVNRLFPGNRWLQAERYLDRPRDRPFDVEQPAAAALLVRRRDFEALSGFDPAFAPAWFEDVDLCARLWKSGRRIRYVPSARATHVGGSTMRRLPYRDFLPLYTRNLLRYLARHGSLPSRLLARPVLAAGALLRLGILPVATGEHSRGETAAAYVRVLRGLSGLGFRSSLLGNG